jgi:hypothetical protein
MIDWERWGGEPSDRYQIAMLLVLSVAVIGLTALQIGLVDTPGRESRPTTNGCQSGISPVELPENHSGTPVGHPLDNASLRCPPDTRRDSLWAND